MSRMKCSVVSAQIQESIDDDLEDYKPRKKLPVLVKRSTDFGSAANDFKPKPRASKYAARLESSGLDHLSDDIETLSTQKTSSYSSLTRSRNVPSLKSPNSIDEDLYSRPKYKSAKPASRELNLSDEDEDLTSRSRFSKYSLRNKKPVKDYSFDEEEISKSSKYSKYSSRSKKYSAADNLSSDEDEYQPRSRSSKFSTQPRRYSFEDDLTDEDEYQSSKLRSKYSSKPKKKYSLDDDLSPDSDEPLRSRYSSRSKRDKTDLYDDDDNYSSSRYKSRNYRSSYHDDSYESYGSSSLRSRRHTTDLSPLSTEAAELRSRRRDLDKPLSADSRSRDLWTRTSPPRSLDLPFTREFLQILKGSLDKKEKSASSPYSPDTLSPYKPKDPSSWLQESSSTYTASMGIFLEFCNRFCVKV